MVGIDSDFDADILDLANPAIPDLLDVRVWGLQATLPPGGGAPMDHPEAQIEDVRVRILPSGMPTLIGGPVTNRVLAYVDYTIGVLRTYDPGDLTCPAVSFFEPTAPDSPPPLYWVELDPFGSTTPSPMDGASRGERYYLAGASFLNGTHGADDGAYNFLYDTGTTTTMVSSEVANQLGINLDDVAETVVVGDLGVLNGYLIDAFEITPLEGSLYYRIENPLVFVNPAPVPFGGAADAIIGTNFFETTQILFDGPNSRLGLFVGVGGSFCGQPGNEGLACEDEDPCTVGEACKGGICTPRGLLDCGGADLCPPPSPEDGDADGLSDLCDNCSTVKNASQDDSDADQIGDACDNCRGVQNTPQADDDQDGIGNLCDGDFDQSGFCNVTDLLMFLDAFGKSLVSSTCPDESGDPTGACARYDLTGEGAVINVSDLLELVDPAVFGTPNSAHGCAEADDGLVHCPLP
jgi:hypothetical protein